MTDIATTAVKDLKAGDIIELQDGLGKVLSVDVQSHMPRIFQDAFGRDGRSVHFLNLDGPHKGKKGVERVHQDTTINVVPA